MLVDHFFGDGRIPERPLVLGPGPRLREDLSWAFWSFIRPSLPFQPSGGGPWLLMTGRFGFGALFDFFRQRNSRACGNS